MISRADIIDGALEHFIPIFILYSIGFLEVSAHMYFFIFGPLVEQQLGSTSITLANFLLYNFALNYVWNVSQVFLIGLTLLLALFLSDLEIPFARLIKIVFVANCIFIVSDGIKNVWFDFFAVSYDISEISNFSPGSLANIWDEDPSIKGLFTFLKSANIYRLSFFLIISVFVAHEAKISLMGAAGICFIGYVIPYLTWHLLLILVYNSI